MDAHIESKDTTGVFNMEHYNDEDDDEFTGVHALHRVLANPDLVKIVATHNDREVVGFAFYTVKGQAIHIKKLFVHPNPRFRRKGIGGTLLLHIVSQLHGNLKYLKCWVAQSNLEARQFLEMTLSGIHEPHNLFIDSTRDRYQLSEENGGGDAVYFCYRRVSRRLGNQPQYKLA